MRYLRPRKRVLHLRGTGDDPYNGPSIEGVVYARTRADYVVLDARMRKPEGTPDIPIGHVEIPRRNVVLLQVRG